MKATYKIQYKDAAGVEREIVTEDMNRDAPGWRSQHGWERIPRPDGRESVMVQYLAGGGRIGTLGEIESAYCLSTSWAEDSIEATGTAAMPDWLAKIYTPPLAIYHAGGSVPQAPAAEIERVRSLAVEMIRAGLVTDSTFRAIVEERQKSNAAALAQWQNEERVSAAHPSRVRDIRRGLGRVRVISAARATSIIHSVAPDEAAPEKIIAAVSEPAAITIWSPDGRGGMRYDQPGTIHHTPLIAFVPRQMRREQLPSQLDRALVLRISGGEL